MFKRILVANRGEIALRIIRAAHDLGIEAVAVFSEADRDAAYVKVADDSVCIGPAPSAESYLDITRIISAAEITGAEAIHPGYGFLAENAHFAEVCEACDMVFIGPSASIIDSCGDKSNAKETARRAGVPVVPGSDGVVAGVEHGAEIAEQVGYPVMIKAAAGGGGRGMRRANHADEFASCFNAAQQEAIVAFNDDKVYIEKFVEEPRHVEVQILADNNNHVIHLGERDCSIQRRHQKLIEESPSPATTDSIRQAMGEAAINFAKESGYVNAGTVEFLLDKHGDFFFIELNARIQVEHCVTEVVTGIDIVKWQIMIAAGIDLDIRQSDVCLTGHAIEFRINAENVARNFAPAPGTITDLYFPGGRGVRIDTHVDANYKIPTTYDSMIAKLIVHGKDRTEAIQIGKRALAEVVIDGPGVFTTVPLHLEILDDQQFVDADFDTSYLDTFLSK